MGENQKIKTGIAIIQLVPNMLTITAICAGLSAIRFGVQGNYVLAVQLILAASILDGLDGRIARLLSSDSKIGAELDSLADFVNFGVAPALLLYFWALQDMRSAAWISVLVYSVCCVLRLARFNVTNKADDDETQSEYFSGIPSPAGALLVMLPMYVSFAFADKPLLPDVLICAYMIIVGLAMISNLPIWSFKTFSISHKSVKLFLVGIAFAGAAVLTYPWITMVVLCFGYVWSVAWCFFMKAPTTTSKRG